LPFETIGVEKPNPTGASHFGVRPVEGKEVRMPVSVQALSRLGPRHCGQSAASKGPAMGKSKQAISGFVRECRRTSKRTPFWGWSSYLIALWSNAKGQDRARIEGELERPTEQDV